MTEAQRSLRDREIAKALDRLTGKQTTHQIRDHLKSLGLIVVPDNLQEQYELDQARIAVQNARRFRNKDDGFFVDFINLIEVDENNTKSRYYKKSSECTIEEAIYFMGCLAKNRRYWDKQIRYYYKLFSKKLGSEFQIELPFGIDDPASV